jgi:phage shock protein PspC (stress-responsive transcriptional regulator)
MGNEILAATIGAIIGGLFSFAATLAGAYISRPREQRQVTAPISTVPGKPKMEEATHIPAGTTILDADTPVTLTLRELGNQTLTVRGKWILDLLHNGYRKGKLGGIGRGMMQAAFMVLGVFVGMANVVGLDNMLAQTIVIPFLVLGLFFLVIGIVYLCINPESK